MGFTLKSFGTSLWLGLKCFKIAWFRVRLGLLALSVLAASFFTFSSLLEGLSLLTLLPIGVIMVIAFSAVMLHLVKWSLQEIALFKALGARRGTLTVAVLLELSILGLSASALGLGGGLALIFLLEGFKGLQLSILPTLTIILLSVLLGSMAGSLSVWRSSKRNVAEIMAYAG